MRHQLTVATMIALFLAALLVGCQTPPDNMPPPNSQVGQYQAGSGVSNGSYDEYPRHPGESGSSSSPPATQPAGH